jgi:hypothetical protein
VSTPRGVEFEENILVVIDDKILVGVSHHDCDGSFLGFRNRLRLDAGLNLAIKNILDELPDVFGIDFLGLVVRVLGVLLRILDSESGECLRVKVEVSGMGTEHLSINCGDVNGSLVLFSNGLEFLGVLITLLLSLSEDVRERDTGLEHGPG